jgi:hypothetical protein
MRLCVEGSNPLSISIAPRPRNSFGQFLPSYLRNAPILTRFINLCWLVFQWCLVLTVAGAVLAGGYLYLRLDDEIRRQVEHRLASQYPGLQVHVGRARFEQDQGIAIYDVVLTEKQSSNFDGPMLSIGEMYLAGKIRMEELVTSDLPISEIVVRRAVLKAARHADGNWNIQALLPPPHFGPQSPAVKIEDATLIVQSATTPAEVHTFQGIDMALKPMEHSTGANAVTKRFSIEGSATGVPARELRFNGEVDTTTGELNVTANVGGLEVSSELLSALPGMSGQLRGTEFSGRGDLAVQINRSAADAALIWSADVTLDRGRLTHPMLPDPMTEMRIVGRATPERLIIQRLDARCGPATIAAAGERVGWTTSAPMALAAKVAGLSLDDRWPARLPESLARIWQRFRPAGTVDAELRVTFDGGWRPQLVANCRGLSLTDAEKFPYVLEQTTGRLEYRPSHAAGPDELHLDLTGFGAGRPVRIQAELKHVAPPEAKGVTRDSGLASKQTSLLQRRLACYRGASGQRRSSPRHHPVGWVEITGNGVSLHEQLIAALPKGGPLVRSLRAQGAVDFRFRAEWKDLSQTRANVVQEIRLKDCTIQYDAFPFPLRRVHGLVAAENWHWTIHDVEGRGGNDSTIVKCRGRTIPRGDEFQSDLIFETTNVPLDDNLKRALPLHVQQAWDALRPHGRIDFTAHVLHDTEQEKPVVEVTLKPCERSVSIEPVRFPYRLQQLEGEAIFQQGRVELRNVSATHDRVACSAAHVTGVPTPDGGWRIALNDFNVDRLAPHPDLLVALPARLQRILDRLQPSGAFSIHNSTLNFAISPGVANVAAAWDLNLVCFQARLGGGFPARSITGEVRLAGRDDGHTAYTAGELNLDSLVWKDVQLTNVHGPLWGDSSVCLFGEQVAQKTGQPPRRITADAYGGSLAANGQIQHQSDTLFSLDMALGGANLARFANERLGGPTDMNGIVSGRLVLSGTQSSPQNLNGTGEMHVVDANIYELPVLVSMLKVLRNRTPDTTAFNRCDMKFSIHGDRIHFQQLNLLGDAVSLYGKGESGFDRQLDLVFYTLPEPANLPIPLWKTIAGHVSQQTLQLNVVGTWDDAEVRPETLPGVNQVWEQIQSEFQQGAATMAPATANRNAATAR